MSTGWVTLKPRQERNVWKRQHVRKTVCLQEQRLWLAKLLNLLKLSGFCCFQPGLTVKGSTFCLHSAFMWFVCISEQTAIIFLYSINWLLFITETQSFTVHSSSYSWSLKSVSFRRCFVHISIDMLLLAVGQAGEGWDPPKKLICNSDFRTGRFLTFPLGDRLSLSAKRRRASRGSLLRAWPQGFRTTKQGCPRFLRFL
jgi:hypothetical protein